MLETVTNISYANDSGIYGTVEEVFRKVSSYAPEDVIKRIFFEFEVGKKLYLNHTHVKLLNCHHTVVATCHCSQRKGIRRCSSGE